MTRSQVSPCTAVVRPKFRSALLVSALTLASACSANPPATEVQGEVLPAATEAPSGNPYSSTSSTNSAPFGGAATSAATSAGPLPKFEVTESTQCYQPTPVEGISLDGDLVVNGGVSDLVRDQITEVRGSLIVKQSDLPIALPRLQRVLGDLRMDSTPVVEFSAPSLTRVGGDVWFYLNSSPAGVAEGIGLQTLDLRNLKTIGGRLFIHRNAELTSLQLDALTEVGGSREISGNARLPQCLLVNLSERFSIDPESNGPAKCTCQTHCSTITANCEPLP